MGTPLTGVANGTVQLTVSGLSATYTRARVSTTGATLLLLAMYQLKLGVKYG